jgi:hypothetical protein
MDLVVGVHMGPLDTVQSMEGKLETNLTGNSVPDGFPCHLFFSLLFLPFPYD